MTTLRRLARHAVTVLIVALFAGAGCTSSSEGQKTDLVPGNTPPVTHPAATPPPLVGPPYDREHSGHATQVDSEKQPDGSIATDTLYIGADTNHFEADGNWTALTLTVNMQQVTPWPWTVCLHGLPDWSCVSGTFPLTIHVDNITVNRTVGYFVWLAVKEDPSMPAQVVTGTDETWTATITYPGKVQT